MQPTATPFTISVLMIGRLLSCFACLSLVLSATAKAAEPGDTDRLCGAQDVLDDKDVAAGWEARQRCDYKEAIRLFSQFLERDPNNVAILSERGLLYTRTGELDRAMSDAHRAIQLNPRCPGAYYVRGIVFRHRDELDKAISDLSEAIRLDPEDGDTIAIRGEVYRQQGDQTKAMADFNRAVELDPTHAIVFCERGDLKNGLGDYEGATADYLKAQELDPKYPAPYISYAWMLATCADPSVRDPDMAAEYAKIGMDLNPRSEDAWAVYAAALAAAGKFDEAAEWQQRVADSRALSEHQRLEAQSMVGLYKSHNPLTQPGPDRPNTKTATAAQSPTPTPSPSHQSDMLEESPDD